MSVFVVGEGGNVPLVVFDTQTTPNGQIFYDAPQFSTRQPSQAHGAVRRYKSFKDEEQKDQDPKDPKDPNIKKGNTKKKAIQKIKTKDRCVMIRQKTQD